MYKVIKRFKDLQDNDHIYHAGDTFPREGVEVSEDRINELSSDVNRRGEPLIEAVPEDIPKEVVSEPKEDIGDVQTGESPSKKTKAKKSTKKAQE